MLLPLARTEQRRRLLSKPFPQTWLTFLRDNVFLYRSLSEVEREKLRNLLRVFIAEKFWEGCGNLQITEEIQVTIAGQACLLLLGFEDYCFEDLQTVLVYPGGYLASNPYQPDDPSRHLLGAAHFKGPVVLSWWHVLWSGRRRGHHNLVIHEFAHKLAELGDPQTGKPPLLDPAFEVRWDEVMAAEYDRHREHAQYDRPTLLDPYGASNPAEFFAVSSECFFLQPVLLRRRHRQLYEVLAQFYRQDPAQRSPLDSEDFTEAAQAEHKYYEHVIAECSSAIRQQSDDKTAYETRAHYYSELGKYDEAIADYHQVIRLDAGDPEAFCNRGSAYLAKNCAEQALADFNEAVRLCPDFSRAFCDRGLAHAALGNRDQALTDLTRAICIDPKDDTARLERGRFYCDHGQYDKAIRDFSKAIRLYPYSPVPFIDRAKAYLKIGEYDQAISDCDEAIDLDPNQSESFLQRGLARHQKGQLDGAIADLTAAIRLDPKFVDAYLARAEVYAAQGEEENARQDQEAAQKLKPKKDESVFGVGANGL